METVRRLFEESGLSLQELGEKMGFEPSTARQAAFQFLRVNDPRLSSLRRFTTAMEIPMFLDSIPSHLATCKKCGTEIACYGGRDVPEPAKGTATALVGHCPNCGTKILVDVVRTNSPMKP